MEPSRFYSRCAAQWQKALDGIAPVSEPGVYGVEHGVVLPLRRREDGGKNANLYEGGVCRDGWSFAAGLQRMRRNFQYNLQCVRGYVPAGKVEERDERVVYGGVIFGHFGHQLIDGFTRLWHFARHHAEGLKYVFVLQPGASPKYAQAFFALAGLDNYEIITAPTRFKEVICPEEAFFSGGGCHPAWLEWFDHIAATVGGGEALPDKIYLTRTQWKAQDGVGEEYFEEFFKNQGYEVIAPETLPLADQVRHIASASRIACTMGTMAHLLAFARSGADVTILLRSPESVMPAQLNICEARRFDWRMVDGTANPLPTGQSNGAFFYWPTREFYRWCDDAGLPRLTARRVGLNYEENVAEYLWRWTERFSDPANFKYIEGRTARDFVDSLREFYGKSAWK